MDTTSRDTCPACGMAVATGSNPTTRGGTTYSCDGCANGRDCTCSSHQHSH